MKPITPLRLNKDSRLSKTIDVEKRVESAESEGQTESGRMKVQDSFASNYPEFTTILNLYSQSPIFRQDLFFGQQLLLKTQVKKNVFNEKKRSIDSPLKQTAAASLTTKSVSLTPWLRQSPTTPKRCLETPMSPDKHQSNLGVISTKRINGSALPGLRACRNGKN